MNLIFDTHAHYDDEAFDADREALLASMPENGVGLIVDPGCDLDTSRRAVEIAEQYPHVYAAVGWHPENSTRCAHGQRTRRSSPLVRSGSTTTGSKTRRGNSSRRFSATSSRWRRNQVSPSSCTTATRMLTASPS